MYYISCCYKLCSIYCYKIVMEISQTCFGINVAAEISPEVLQISTTLMIV